MSEDRGFSNLAQGVRRVITGVDADGKAVVVKDERLTGDPRSLAVWAGDAAPVMGRSDPPATLGWWPPPGGVRVSLSTRAPDAWADPNAPRPAHLPDINDAAGFHASQSTDVIIIISGVIWCELDDGVEVELHAGDVLIQNGTRHKWSNRGVGWPVMAAVIIGAHPPAGPSS